MVFRPLLLKKGFLTERERKVSAYTFFLLPYCFCFVGYIIVIKSFALRYLLSSTVHFLPFSLTFALSLTYLITLLKNLNSFYTIILTSKLIHNSPFNSSAKNTSYLLLLQHWRTCRSIYFANNLPILLREVEGNALIINPVIENKSSTSVSWFLIIGWTSFKVLEGLTVFITQWQGSCNSYWLSGTAPKNNYFCVGYKSGSRVSQPLPSMPHYHRASGDNHPLVHFLSPNSLMTVSQQSF